MPQQNKTQKTTASVDAFIASVPDAQKRQDSETLLALMGKITGAQPVMWGDSIIGFGDYHYKYKSGREGDWFVAGFSPRKQAMSLYLSCDLAHDALRFDGLGKYKTGRGCLYIKRLCDVDMAVLERLLTDAVKIVEVRYTGEGVAP